MIRATTPSRRLRRAVLVGLAALAVPLLVAGCTNSPFLVGVFYDRLDDKAIDAADEWVGFTAAQADEFDAYAGTFHTWHRRAELPRYAALMRDMTRGLSTWDQATPEDFTGWFDAVRSRAEALRACHPARFATPLVRTLSQQQIDRMERIWREKRAENIDRAGERTRAERIERRVENIDTWAGRLGVDLDPDQLTLLEDAFLRQVSLHDEYRALSDDWNGKLFALARDADAPDHDVRMEAHVDDWFDMVEKAHPERWAANRLLWRDTAVAFEKTLSRQQRRDALRWVNKMADTLDTLALDTPDWLPGDDPRYGCTPGTGAASAAERDDA